MPEATWKCLMTDPRLFASGGGNGSDGVDTGSGGDDWTGVASSNSSSAGKERKPMLVVKRWIRRINRSTISKQQQQNYKKKKEIDKNSGQESAWTSQSDDPASSESTTALQTFLCTHTHAALTVVFCFTHVLWPFFETVNPWKSEKFLTFQAQSEKQFKVVADVCGKKTDHHQLRQAKGPTCARDLFDKLIISMCVRDDCQTIDTHKSPNKLASTF